MAMDRLGSDLEKVLEHNGGRLRKSTVLQLGQRLVAVLEYIHENEYVHADIKAANLMLGYRDPEQVYLADYGLSYRYCPDGVHKEYKENPKKGHNGTIEYTSLDAHRGLDSVSLPSRGGCLLLHPDVVTSRFWGFVFFTGYVALCLGIMFSRTQLRSKRPRPD